MGRKKLNTESIVPQTKPEDKITQTLRLANEYWEVTHSGVLDSISANPTIVAEIESFCKSKLESLLNLKKEEKFNSQETQVLKRLASKVFDAQPSTPKVDEYAVSTPPETKPEEIIAPAPVVLSPASAEDVAKEIGFGEPLNELTAPVAVTPSAIGPPPKRKFKPVYNPATQQPYTPADQRNYAANQVQFRSKNTITHKLG